MKRVGSSDGLILGSWVSSHPSSASTRPQLSHGSLSADSPGILRDGRVPDFEAALRWVMKGVVSMDRKVLRRKTPAQNLNTVMVGLVEVSRLNVIGYVKKGYVLLIYML